jgi:hypothetical protein
VTAWARLTWQALQPAALAAELGRQVGAVPRAGGLVAGASEIDLGSAWLEVRPWVSEHPADRPDPGGRLVLEPVPGGDQATMADGAGPAAAPGAGLPAAAGPQPGHDGHPPTRLLLAGIGWATVDADRAESELGMWLRAAAPGSAQDLADAHLGALARARATAGLPGDWLVLLEPTSEGPVAAALARHGEGPCALYLWPVAGFDAWRASAAGRTDWPGLGDVRRGPFGRQARFRGSAAGPHVIVTEGRTPSS